MALVTKLTQGPRLIVRYRNSTAAIAAGIGFVLALVARR